MAAEGEGIEIKASEDVGITHMEKSDNLPDFDGPSASVEAPDPDKYQEGIAAATLPTAPAPLVQKTSLKKKGIYIEASATAAGPVLPPPESESLSSYDAMMQVIFFLDFSSITRCHHMWENRKTRCLLNSAAGSGTEDKKSASPRDSDS